jgi:hypothetical protein
LLGIVTITSVSHDVSRQALTFWWPVQYAWRVIDACKSGEVSPLTALAGGPYTWFRDVPAGLVSSALSVDIEVVGLLLFALGTAANLRILVKSKRRSWILVCAPIQVLAYYFLKTGVQINHYFIAIPLLALLVCRVRWAALLYLASSAVFLFQDLAFYGFGRDLNYGTQLLAATYLGWTTNLVALISSGLFVAFVVLASRAVGPATMARHGLMPKRD